KSPPPPINDFPVYVEPQDGLKAANKIDSLPGQPIVKFNQYSGYVTVDGQAGRALFYYFVESSDKPSTKPLVLWLNGGPGCSSVGAGAMSELGPFRVQKDGKTLKRNQYSWIKKANILFLDSPAGVGFSYSNTTLDYEKSGDNRTATDSYTFLVNWLERFPEYKNRDFFIAGESYAGHYVPQLAYVILEKNKMKSHQSRFINLRGIAVGNGLIDEPFNDMGIRDFLYTHTIISEKLKENYTFCEPSTWQTKACNYLRDQVDLLMNNINVYDIYAPQCNATTDSPPNTKHDPCIDDYIEAYMNTPAVQKALHANVTALPYRWEECSKKIINLWIGRELSILPTIRELMASGVRVWLYSGDTDSAVPVTGTEYAIKELGAPVKTDWYAWYNAPKEVGGFVVEYENLTFVTVRGAGHFVPSYQPNRAFTIFSSFLEGKLPPQANIPPPQTNNNKHI
ncbi:hypothetical protein AQUCO_01500147v1, partial [Aquilegia coerulea]